MNNELLEKNTGMYNKVSCLFYMGLSLLLLLIEHSFISENETMTRILQFQLIAIFGMIFWSSYKKFGLFSLISLILIGFFLFSIGGILHFLLSGENICELNIGFGYFEFKHRLIQETLLVYSVFLLYLYLSYCLFNKYNKNEEKEICFNSSHKFFVIGKTLMWLFLFIEIYKGYLYFQSFSMERVLLFLNGSNASPIPIWVRFFATFFEIGYLFILASKPEEKHFKGYSLLYFVVLIPEILIGNRMQLGVFLLYFFWYSNKIYKKQPFKTSTIVIFGFVMLLFFQAIEFYRNGLIVQDQSFSPTRFLAGQAVSFYLVPLYMIYASQIQYYSYPFVFYNILSGITGYGYNGQSIEVLEHNCGIGHQLVYAINPDVYLAGYSLGTSGVCELYEFGFTGIIIGAIIFAFMVKICENIVSRFRLGLFLSFTLVGSLVVFARSSFFPSAYMIIKYIVFYESCIIAFQFLIKQKTR